jgi:transcriptional regulator with XRE-family HTH domain
MAEQVPGSGGNDDWRSWLRTLGRQARRCRELLGYSQDQLGRLAGISQGAVSRLEAGRGLATPAVVVLKVYRVLVRGMKLLDPLVLPDDAKQLIEIERWISPDADGGGVDQPRSDDALTEVLRSYRRLSPAKRDAFVAIAKTVLVSLVAGETPAVDSHPEFGPVPRSRRL